MWWVAWVVSVSAAGRSRGGSTGGCEHHAQAALRLLCCRRLDCRCAAIIYCTLLTPAAQEHPSRAKTRPAPPPNRRGCRSAPPLSPPGSCEGARCSGVGGEIGECSGAAVRDAAAAIAARRQRRSRAGALAAHSVAAVQRGLALAATHDCATPLKSGALPLTTDETCVSRRTPIAASSSAWFAASLLAAGAGAGGMAATGGLLNGLAPRAGRGSAGLR